MKPVKMQKIIREIQKNLKLSTDVTVVTVSSVFPCELGVKNSTGTPSEAGGRSTEGSHKLPSLANYTDLPSSRVELITNS